MEKKIHVICGSHIDPVWLWNRSVGRSSWNNTATSVVKMLEERTNLRFTCSTAAMHRHLEETEPELFETIRQLVRENRWELTGGWEVQSDAVIASADSLLRQGLTGRRYFRDKFGADVKTAFNVDSFGHAAGLPKILRASGLERYVYVRGQDTPTLFRWKSDDGSTVIAHHVRFGYGMASTITKEEIFRNVETLLKDPFPLQTLFVGVGDHGGGFSRRQLEFVEEAMTQFPLVYSTLNEYFAEAESLELPEITGMLGPVFRGCYSAAHSVKQQTARAMRTLQQAEFLGAEPEPLEDAWRETLFCHFHDSFSGTCIREAYERDIFPALGLACHKGQEITDRLLMRYSSAHDTRFMPEGGFYVCNPLPYPVTVPVEFPGFLDPNHIGTEFNCLNTPSGGTQPLQVLPAATSYGPYAEPWGILTATVRMGPGEEKLLAYGRGVKPAKPIGFERQHRLLRQLHFEIHHDDDGTWGFTLNSYSGHHEVPETVKVEELADGPVCSVLLAEFRYNKSSFALKLTAFADLPEIRLELDCFYDEPYSALKLAWTNGDQAEMFHAGGIASIETTPVGDGWGKSWNNASGRLERWRGGIGEQPMLDFCALSANGILHGFFSDDIHAADCFQNALRLTLLRSVPYADHKPFTASRNSGMMERGEQRFTFWFFESAGMLESLPQKARIRLMPTSFCEVTGHPARNQSHPLFAPPLTGECCVLESMPSGSGSGQGFIINYGESVDGTAGTIPGGNAGIFEWSKQQTRNPGNGEKIQKRRPKTKGK